MRTKLLLGWMLLGPAVHAQTVRVSVLTLFHPRVLLVNSTTLAASSSGLTVDGVGASSFTLANSTFTLAVPHKLSRRYVAALSVTVRNGELLPILTLPTELAVASIVAAEAPPHAPLEALKAQAVASRSFLLANKSGHVGYDACDTTHCQFLRSPPPTVSPASVATRATRGLVLTWRPDANTAPLIVRAMYSRSCGGLTRVPKPATANAYPYYQVPCDFCRRHPDRAHVYSHGHGVGLCQLGADDLAARGQTAAQILAHYFPNTSLTRLANSP